MSKIKLNATNRKLKEKREGQIPAVLYGKGVENENLWVDSKEFIKVYREAGESTLIDLSINKNQSRSVLIHDVQRHPLMDDILHIDFYQVKMDEKIETEIELNFTGVSPAVKEMGGTFVKNLDKIPIRALPGDLVSSITVDISVITDFDKYIHVKELKIPEEIEVLIEEDTVIALVSPPKTKAEIEKLDEEVDMDISQVEGISEEKDGESGEEVGGKDKEVNKEKESEGK